MKEVISKLDFIKIKNCERQCQGNVKISHRPRENICKMHTHCLKYKRIPKIQQENNLILKWAKYLKR